MNNIKCFNIITISLYLGVFSYFITPVISGFGFSYSFFFLSGILLMLKFKKTEVLFLSIDLI